MSLDRPDGIDLQNTLANMGSGASGVDSHSNIAATIEFKVDETSLIDAMTKAVELSPSQMNSFKQLQEKMWESIFGAPTEQMEKLSKTTEQLFKNMIENISRQVSLHGENAARTIQNALNESMRLIPEKEAELRAMGATAADIDKWERTNTAVGGPMASPGLTSGDIRMRALQEAEVVAGSLSGGSDYLMSPQQGVRDVTLGNPYLEQAAQRTQGYGGQFAESAGFRWLASRLSRPAVSYNMPSGGMSAATMGADFGHMNDMGMISAQMGAGGLGEQLATNRGLSGGAQNAMKDVGGLAGRFGKMIPGMGELAGLGAGAGMVGVGGGVGLAALVAQDWYTNQENQYHAMQKSAMVMGYAAEQADRMYGAVNALGKATLDTSGQMEALQKGVMGLGFGAGFTNAAIGAGAAMVQFNGMSGQQATQAMGVGRELGITPFQTMNLMAQTSAGSQYTNMSVPSMQAVGMAGMQTAASMASPAMTKIGQLLPLAASAGQGKNDTPFGLNMGGEQQNFMQWLAQPLNQMKVEGIVGNVNTNDPMALLRGSTKAIEKMLREAGAGVQGPQQVARLMAIINALGLNGIISPTTAVDVANGQDLLPSIESAQKKLTQAGEKAMQPRSWHEFGEQSVKDRWINNFMGLMKNVDHEGAEKAFAENDIMGRIGKLKMLFPGGIPEQIAEILIYDPNMTKDKFEHFHLKLKGGKDIALGQILSSGDMNLALAVGSGNIRHDMGLQGNALTADFLQGSKFTDVGSAVAREFDPNAKSSIAASHIFGQANTGSLPVPGTTYGSSSGGSSSGAVNYTNAHFENITVSPKGAQQLNSINNEGAAASNFLNGISAGSHGW